MINCLQVTFLRNIVWTLSNLCRNKNPPPPFEMIEPALPIFNRLLTNEDQDVLGKTFTRLNDCIIFYMIYFLFGYEWDNV